MRVASTLSWISGRRPASRSRWKLCGMMSAKVSRPASMRASISVALISSGGMKYGGWNASRMRADSGERSSSTMPTGALLSVSGWAVAAVYTETENTYTIRNSRIGSRPRLRSSLTPRCQTLLQPISTLLLRQQGDAEGHQHRHRHQQGVEGLAQILEPQPLGEH